ncbi:MAG: GtrA family protein [Hyphomicrobiaceae bacterium]
MATGKRASGRDAAADLEPTRHWLGFLASGAIAFTVDAGLMEACVRVLGLPTLVARLIGVAGAMLAAWLSHRTLTFAVRDPPSLPELARYVAAASTTALINYAVFAAAMIAWPWAPRIGVLVAASCVATIFAYVSMRYGVFRRNRE